MWKPATSATTKTMTGVVTMTSASTDIFLIGRFIDPATSLTIIGKVFNGPTQFRFAYWDSNTVTELNKTTGFDVLACAP